MSHQYTNTLSSDNQRDDLERYNKWEEWISTALTYSRNGETTVLIIDKDNHSCFVIENGELTYDFQIEMGLSYYSDKTRKDDKATAEGSYYITHKKEGTIFNNYKIIMLNYPNKEDSLRFEEDFRNKKIPSLDILNNKLSIHGNGGKGYNLTDGCIALLNSDIDLLYPKVKIGTRVVIVGSTRGILEIKDNDNLYKDNFD